METDIYWWNSLSVAPLKIIYKIFHFWEDYKNDPEIGTKHMIFLDCRLACGLTNRYGHVFINMVWWKFMQKYCILIVGYLYNHINTSAAYLLLWWFDCRYVSAEVHCKYHDRWCLGDGKNLGISSYDIDQIPQNFISVADAIHQNENPFAHGLIYNVET